LEDLQSRFYVAMDVADRPNVLSQIAGVFGRHEVSIESVQQKGLGDEARLNIVTHTAQEREMRAVLAEVRELDVVDRVQSVIRVIGEDG
jgi:homoserine dehydrogenase